MNTLLFDRCTGELERLAFWLWHIPDGTWLIALYDEADAPAEFVKFLDDMPSLELTFEQVKMIDDASSLTSSLSDETRGVLSVSGLMGVGGVAREALDALCDALYNQPHVLLLWLTLEERDAWLQGESTIWSRSWGYFDLRTAAQADALDPCPDPPIRFSNRADWEAQVEFVQEALIERRQRAHPLDELGLDLYNRLLNLYTVMGAYQQVEDIAQELLQVSQSQGSKRGLATAYNDLGLCRHMWGDLQGAIHFYQQALSLYQEDGGALSGEAITLLNMGAAYRDLDQRESRRLLEEALSLAQSIGARSPEATILDHLGGFYTETGDDDQALAYFSQALPIRREVADRRGEANTLSNLGRIYTKREEFQRAQEAYEQALVIHRELGVRRGEALTLNLLGRLFSRQSDEQQAVAYYRQALRIWQESGDQYNQAIVLNNIGVARHEAANRRNWKAIWSGLTFAPQTTPDSDTSLLEAEEESQAGGEDEKAAVLEAGQQALDAYGAALDIRRDLGRPDDRERAAKLLMAMAEVYRLMERHAQAQDSYAQALDIWETLGDQVMQVQTWINIGQFHAAQEDQPQALDAYDRAWTILEVLGQHPEMPGLLNTLGEAYEQSAPERAIACYTRSFGIGMEEAALDTHPLYRIEYIDPQRAMTLASEALERSRARDQPIDEAWLLNVIGDLHKPAERYAQALAYYNQALARSRKLGDRQLEAQALQNLASVHSSMGETERALERYTQSAAIWRDLEALFAEGRVLNHMIVALGDDSERIIPVLERKIEIDRALGMSTTDWERMIEIHHQITSGERVLSDESAR
jgi:tetratricopeptide (TPR) repeat protein